MTLKTAIIIIIAMTMIKKYYRKCTSVGRMRFSFASYVPLAVEKILINSELEKKRPYWKIQFVLGTILICFMALVALGM
jgi:hypothetical protein